MKRFISLTLVTVLIVALLAGCGSNDDKTTVNDPKPIETVGENEYGWEMPSETIEFTYFAGQGNPDDVEKESKLISEFLLQNFNVKINKMVYDTDRKERLNLMLASNDYPDVITGLDLTDVNLLVELDKTVELTSLIEEYGPNITERYGDTIERYKTENGELNYLMKGWGFLPIPDNSATIRYDIWQNMGAPEIITTDDYYKILKQMVEENPVNADGKNAYALSYYGGESANILEDWIQITLGMWGLKDGYKEDENYQLTHWANTEEGLEMTIWMNQFFRDGLLDPDSVVNTFDDWKSKVSTERAYGHIGRWWDTWNAGHEVWQKTDENWQDDKRFVHVNVKNEDAEQVYLSPKNTNGWSATVITDKCENPEEVMKWLDFEISDMGTRINGWGVPNLDTSSWDTDGSSYTFREEAKQGVINGTYDYEIGSLLGQYEYWLVMGQKPLADGTNVWFDQNFNNESKWKKVMNDNLVDTIYDFSAYRNISYEPDNPLTVVKQQVQDVILTGWTYAITAETEEQCIQRFEELQEKANEAGLQDLEAYITEQYNNNLDAWKMK
ncbi:type 2 periplasmic-binding domain-containing protein [Vallitalea okinawensis]|uniref:sugar ABC transporter substrate-binding protein n=1 Tax=Vallitalea okinawensis TaxID=2078660 RepID=UPI000CFD97D3|nr:sugar ABC transporter substrate-binding protein [Vallitalea okinawensis]